MSNILVTGSEGSLMQAVIPLLVKNGHTVVGVDNLSRHSKVGEYTSPRYFFNNADASSFGAMNELFQFGQPTESNAEGPGGEYDNFTGFDYVIQGAATVFGIGGFNAHCAEILTKDLEIQSNMLRLSQSRKVKKFIYISSSMVYENCTPNPLGNKEYEPTKAPMPKTDYGLSKLVGERMVKAYNMQYSLDYLIWRPFNIITPKEICNQNHQGYNHVFADFIHQIVGEHVDELPILGNGNQVRCFSWIDDVAKCIAENSLLPTKKRCYNIGSTEAVSMKNLAYMIHEITKKYGLNGNKELTFKTTTNFINDVQYRVPNIDDAKEEFGFKTTKNLNESLEECVMYYAREKLKW